MFVKWYLPANTSSIANQGNITIILFAKWLAQYHNIQWFKHAYDKDIDN